MAIQNRRGQYADFDPSKAVPGELLTVLSGDPNAKDGKAVYMTFASGDVKRMATYEDMVDNIEAATEDVAQDVAEQIEENLQSMVQTAQTAAQTATTKANEASQSASSVSASAAQIATNTSDISDLKSAMADAEADIENVLQTKAPVIINSATGQIATFSDGADGMNVKSLKVNMSPIQDLHGYDHPWPAGGGKNLLEVTATSQTVNGVTFTVNEDGTVLINGTSTAGINKVLHSNLQLPSNTYVLSTGASLPEGSVLAVATSGGDKSTRSTSNEFTAAITGDVWFFTQANITFNNVMLKPMIRLASESDATFEPYSNICPISGLDEVEVKRTGKNLLEVTNTGSQTVAGVTYTINNDGSVTCSGTVSGTNAFFIRRNSLVLPQGTYIITGGSGVSSDGVRVVASIIGGSATKWLDITSESGKSFTINEGEKLDSIYLRGATSGTTVNTTIYPMIRLASVSDSTYVPYQGEQTVTESLPEIVYGGALDLETGELVVDRKIVDLGSMAWSALDARNRRYSNDVSGIIKPLANMDTLYPQFRSEQYQSIPNNTLYTNTSLIGITQNSNSIYIRTGSDALPEGKLIYPLATPVTYTLTPKQLETVKGINHISANRNTTIDVDYCADTKLYIDQKLATAIANALNA